MTQPPENPGGPPTADRPPEDQDAGSPATAPPPGSWHFPPVPVGPGHPPPAPGQPNGSPHLPGSPPPLQYAAPPYGTSPHYGTPPPYGAPRPYGQAYPSQATAAPAGPEPDLAEWWRRLLGRIIDIVVLSVLTAPLAIALLSPAFTRYQQTVNRYPDLSQPGAQAAISKADGRLFGAWLVFAAIVAVISFFYDSIQHGLWGRTLGKRALGTRVVSGYDRSKISGGTAAGRAAVYSLIPVVPLVGSVFWVLDALWLTWDRRCQCLHDKAAHTIVVKAGLPAAAPPPGRPW